MAEEKVNPTQETAVSFEDRLTALGESEMAMFRFLLDRPAGVILTVETDKILAQLLERESDGAKG